MVDGNSLCVVSLHLYTHFENMAIFLSCLFFFMDLHVSNPFFVCLDLHVSIFSLLFFIAHVSFVTKDGERDHNYIIWSFYFVGCKMWYSANFSWKRSKGVYSVHVNLDHESMKRILPRVTTI